MSKPRGQRPSQSSRYDSSTPAPPADCPLLAYASSSGLIVRRAQASILIAGLALALLTEAAHADNSREAAPPSPGHYMTRGLDAIEIGTTLQFTPMPSEPVACSERLLGTVSLTSTLRLCVCDGRSWHFESTGERCDWNAKRKAEAR